MGLERRSGILLLGGGVALMAAAVPVWQKDFSTWTDKDALAVMTDSPWAKQIPMPAGGRPGVMVIEPGANGAPAPTAALGNPASSTTGPNMTSSGYPGSAGPADQDGLHRAETARTPSGMAAPTGAPTQPMLRIVWASAIPVRLAVLKLRSDGGSPDETRIANAHKPTQNYVVVIHGLPEPDAASDPKALASGAFLSIKNKPPLAAYESGYWSGPQVYVFRFRKASLPIAMSDREVEFTLTVGQMEIKKKFELKDMQFDGQLAL